MTKLFSHFVICLLLLSLISISFSSDTKIGKGKADVIGIEDSQAVYKVNTSKDDNDITANKLSSKKYEVKVGNSKLFDFEVKNKISANNQLLDCDLLTCDFVLELNPAQAMKFDAEQISGGWQYGNAQVEKVFYYENVSSTRYTPVYERLTHEVCNDTNTSDCTTQKYYNQTGETTQTIYTLVEQTDFSQLTITPSKKTNVIIRFSRPTPTSTVDIFPTIYGYEFKDWAWWNASCTYAMPLTTKLVNGVANQTWAEPNFLTVVQMENISTNATLLNLTNFDNVAFTDATNTTKLNSSIMQANATHVYYRVVIPSQTNATSITAWFCENDYQASNNQSVCDNTNLRSLWGGNNLLDMCKENNLTAQGGAAGAGATYNCKYGKCFNFGEDSFLNSTVIGSHQIGTGVNASTVSMWAFLNNGFDTAFQSLFGFGAGGTNTIRSNVYYTTDQFWQAIGSANPTLAFTGSWATKQTYYAGIVNATGLYSVANQSNAFNANTLANTAVGQVQIGFSPGWAYICAGATTNASMSEVRLYDDSKSLDYLKAEYGIVYVQAGDIEEAASPVTNTPSILNATGGTEFFTNSNLFGWINITGNGTWNINYTFFVNDTANLTGYITGIPGSGAKTNIANITSGVFKGQNWTLQVNATNGTTNISATNSSYIYITNRIPVVSIVFSANGTVSVLGPVQANITVTDGENATLNLTYNWFKNGVNQTGLAGSQVVANASVTTINAGASPYTLGDNWSIRAWASDGENISAYANSANTTIVGYVSGLSLNYTNPIYDSTTSYTHYMNLTKVVGSDLNAVFEWNGINYTATRVVNGTQYRFSQSVPTPSVNTTTNFTARWYYTTTLANGTNYTENTSYNITNYVAGIYLCNSTIYTKTVLINIFDEETGVPVNASIFVIVAPSPTKIQTYSYTNTTMELCILPNTTSFDGTMQLSISAPNYSDRLIVQDINYSNVTQNLSFYLLNTTNGAYYTFTVVNEYSVPVADARIVAYKYNSNSTGFLLVEEANTNPDGTALFFLETQIPHVIYVTKDNYVPLNFTFTPLSLTELTIQLTSNITTPIDIIDYNQQINGVAFSISPSNQTFFNESFNIVFTVNSNTSTLEYFGMVVTRNVNGTTTTVYSQNTSDNVGGTLSYTVNQNGTYIASFFFKNLNYSVYVPNGRMYFFGNKVGVAQVSGEMSEDILSGWAFYFIALIVAMVAGGFISRYSQEGAAGVSLLILWGFTAFWSTAPLIVTGVFILTTFHATFLATIAVVGAMMAMRSMV